MKICITGDSILMAPFPENYTGFEAVKAHIGQADVRINNLEMVISEGDKFASTYCGGIWLTGKPERLDDVCSYGFNCFGFANNHTMDFSYGGMENTLRELATNALILAVVKLPRTVGLFLLCCGDSGFTFGFGEFLGLPETVQPLCAIPIGHHDGTTKPRDKWKPENVHYGRW